MNILFCGLGSIGKRHARLIKEIHPSYNLFACRTKLGQEKVDLPIKEYTDWDKIFQNEKIDITFITNPTYLHVDTALKCAEKNLALFIEKPISHNLKNIEKLNNAIKKKNLFTYIGYNLRFHPVIKHLKREIERNSHPFYFRVICASYLPNWRPHQDYRINYSARKEKGGGVLLELSHELDYINWLFGDIKNITGSHGKISELEINSEDYTDLQITCASKTRGTLHLNYFSYYTERKIQLYFADRYIEGDLINKTVTITKNDSKTEQKNYKLEIDDLYKDELKYFFNGYNKNKELMNNFFEAKKLFKKIIDFKENNKFVKGS